MPVSAPSSHRKAWCTQRLLQELITVMARALEGQQCFCQHHFTLSPLPLAPVGPSVPPRPVALLSRGLVRDTEAGTALGAAALIGCLLLGPLPPPARGPCLFGPCWSPSSYTAHQVPHSLPAHVLAQVLSAQKTLTCSPVHTCCTPPAWHHFQTPPLLLIVSESHLNLLHKATPDLSLHWTPQAWD